MARGSSYGEKPTEPSPEVTTPTSVPRRATRVMQALPVEESEPETQIARPAKSRRAPVTHVPDEPYTEQMRPAKVRRAPVTHDFNQQEIEQARPVKTRRAPGVAPARVVSEYAADEPHPLSRHRSWLKFWLVSLGCVLIGAMILITAAMYLRSQANPQFVNYNGQTFPIELGGSSDAFNLWNNSTGPIPSRTALPKNPGPYSVLGKPTVSANFIDQVLGSYKSPTAGMGQSLYSLGLQYGIDPVYAMAFFMHESLFGTTGEARVTLSLGNERCIPDRPCIDQDRGGYARMNSWQDGFEHWYKLIRNLYVAQWGRVTVDQIIPKYAPNSDGNDEAVYIASLKHTVDTWRAGIIRVS